MSVSKSIYKGNCHVNILVFLISCVLRFVHVDICSYKFFVLLLKSISLYKYIESIFLLVSILLADNFFVVIPVVLLWTFLNIFLHIFRNILCEVFQFFLITTQCEIHFTMHRTDVHISTCDLLPSVLSSPLLFSFHSGASSNHTLLWVSWQFLTLCCSI